MRELVLPLRPADTAELLELLRSDERRDLVEMLGSDLNPEVLSELDESVRDHVMELLDPKDIAAALTEMDSDDAVYLLEDMDEAEQREILDQLPASERAVLEQSLDYPEYSAGRLMQRELVAVPPFWDVGRTLDYLREAEDLPHESLKSSLSTQPTSPSAPCRCRASRVRSVRSGFRNHGNRADADPGRDGPGRGGAAIHQIRSHLGAVVDGEGRLVGVITVDDIVEVISEEAAEDIRLLAGVGEEAISDTVLQTSRSRVPWLAVNLVTAVIAASVIALFDAAIEKMVALAVLMPIVASMGGNAGTQTMTVTVRALATRDLVHFNARRTILREMLVGLLNGLIFAGLLGGIGGLIFQNAWLGGVLAAAMMINLVVASLTGILVPLGLDKLGADPAVSSPVFVTTTTDVVGFFAFLGLAALILFY